MTWTPAGTIQLSRDWQYTEPIATGSYFRLSHSEARNGDLFAVAQCEVDAQGNLSIGDTQVLAVEKGISDVIELPKNAFTDRRIAIKRILSQPSLEQEFRRLFLPNFLIPPEQEIKFIRRNNWAVTVEVSDYVEPTTIVDLTPISEQLTRIEQKIDAISSESPPTPIANLTYSFDGDTNGLIYYLGTNDGTTGFVNPVDLKVIDVFSTPTPSAFAANNLFNRSSSQSFYSNGENAYFGVDLKTKKLAVNYYSLQGNNNSVSEHPRNWKLQGSFDNATWEDVDQQINNTTITAATWVSIPVNSEIAYRYFRILLTGLNSANQHILCVGEWELYGKLFDL